MGCPDHTLSQLLDALMTDNSLGPMQPSLGTVASSLGSCSHG